VVDLTASPPGPALEKAFPDMAALLNRPAAQRLPPSASGKVTPEQVVGMMDAAGVDVAFIASWTGPGKAIISNEKVVTCP
jgi:hypothetical protein